MKDRTTNLGNPPVTAAFPAAALLIAFLRTAYGQAADPVPPEPPRYTVELIVFTYNDDGSAGSEVFVPDRPRPDDYRATDPDAAEGDPGFIFSDQRAGAAGDRRAPDSPPVDVEPLTGSPEITGDERNPADDALRERIELRRLDPDAYTMDAIYGELARLDAYHPILRAAWTQAALAQDVSPAVQLRALAQPPPGLDGTVTLYQGRFVHLDLELTLAGEGSAAGDRRSATDRAIAYGDARVRDEGTEDGSFGGPVRYRISESRIMKNGDIRYYDHPRFGVLAKVTKAQEPGPPVPLDSPASD